MRTVLGTTARQLGRRGIGLERLVNLTLRQDAYADPPGPTLSLAIGERTTYRPGAWLLDEFDRAALGASYPAWGGAPGLTLEAGGVTAAVGPAGMVTHTRLMPRDVWAAVEIAALSGPSAGVGVLLHAGVDDAYRITATSAGATVLERLSGGAPVGLMTVPTPWQAGETLRAELIWTRLRVYRDLIRVADWTVIAPDTVGAPRLWDGAAVAWDAAGIEWDEAGPSGLTGRGVGLVVGRAVGGDAAAVASFVAGEARQEYLGAGLDLGDVQMVLGEPVRFDLTLSNVAPMGGADRFAALLRHGLNTTDTYDLDRGTVRVYTAIQGGTAPLTTAVGLIDAPSQLSEDRVRLDVLGRDAFLTPQLAAGVVTYVAGPPPGGLLPLPADPCAPSVPPVVEEGDPPAEPVDPPTEDGTGPEAPEAPAPDATPPPAPRVTYAVYDVNAETASPAAESDTPTGENVITVGDQPLSGNDVDAGVDTHTVNLYRTGVIGVWAPATAFTGTQRIRRTATDPIVFQCMTSGTTGGAPPAWDDDADAITADGTVNWFSWGEVLPLTSPVPGTHLRLTLSASLVGASDVQIVRKNTAAPPDLDDTLEVGFNHGIGSNTVLHTLSAGTGSTELELAIGDATAITVNPRGASGGSATVSVHAAEFYTPEPP